jgi:hypothetical protein
MDKFAKWSKEYKDSIDCDNPKGFSQRAHCQGLKKKKEKKAEDILNELHTAATTFESLGFIEAAQQVHEEFMRLAGKNHGGLDDWFQEKWVDVRRPKKKGKGYEPCGRGNTEKGKKPVCTPINKAKNLTKKEIENRKRQKARKEKEPNPDKKPNVTQYTPKAGGKSNIS